MKKFWKWTNRIAKNEETQEQTPERTLFLNGTIADESWFDDDVTPQIFKDELMSGSGDITVWINSPGGDCVAAAQIYNKAWEAAKAFVETKRDKDGLLSAEDAASYAEMEQKIKDYGAEIERMEQMTAMDAQLSKPTSTPLTAKPLNGDKPKSGRASDEYKAAMLNALRTNFRQVSDVLSEGVDANGGYLVPEEYDSRLIDTLTEENIMRKLGHTITTSGEHKINIAATKPAAAWIDEGGALSFGDATFAQINLDAHKLHVAVKVTEELLYDNAFGLESYIIEQFGKALSNAEEDAFLNGDGVGKPLGLFSDKGGGEVAVTAASATAITADEITQKRVALDDEGFQTESDVIVATVRAYYEGRHGSEKWANRAAFSEATDLFRFRAIPGVKISTDMRLLCDGSVFEITSVEDVKGRGMYIEVLAKEVKPSG